jgi:hypothetical protein
MKKLMMVIFSLTMVGFILLNMASAKSQTDLFILADLLTEEQINIDKWSFHARESLDTSNREESLKTLMDQFPQWNWKTQGNSEKWKATGVFTTEMGISETISILSSEGHSYLIYEVQGSGWTEKTKDSLRKQIYPKIDAIFHGKATVFSCVYSELDGNMYESVSNDVTKFLQTFQAEEIETLREDNFVSTTAYSPLFSESINGETEKFNFQIGLRKQGLGEKTTLVVGTPILTIEY